MQQAITWANDDPDLCRHMASLGPNENLQAPNLQYIAMPRISDSGPVIIATVTWPTETRSPS